MKLNYVIIPFITIFVAWLGGQFTTSGVGSWYTMIRKPSWTPPGSIIGLVWTIIFILATVAALMVWNSVMADSKRGVIAAAFVLNAALNVLWSLLFFRLHLVGTAVLEAGFLGLSVVLLIILCWPVSRFASALLVPYAAWVGFATYLTSVVWQLNRK